MRLGIGELKLRKKGILPEMQSLAEISHFYVKVILLRLLRTLVPCATKKTAESVSLSPSIDTDGNTTRNKHMNMIGAWSLYPRVFKPIHFRKLSSEWEFDQEKWLANR